MYKVTIDGEILAMDQLEDTALIDPVVTLEANKAGSFKFTIAPSHPYYNLIDYRQSVIEVEVDDEIVFSGVPISEELDFYNRKTVTCEGTLAYLNDTLQRPASYTGMTPATYIAALLTIHNSLCDANKQIQIGSVTVNGSGLDRTTNYVTTLKAISDGLVNQFGGYLRVRDDNGTKKLDYLAASPRTCLQEIRIGENLLDLAQDFDTAEIATVLIPLGKETGNISVQGIRDRLTVKSVNNNKDYIVSTAQGIYGNVWRTKTWNNIDDAATLLSTANSYLTDAQWANLVIDATAFDLGLADSTVQQFRLLDKIRVVSTPHGLDRSFILTKLEMHLNNPGQTRITLGQKTTLSLSAQTAEAQHEIERDLDNIIVTANSNAREILESATGGCVYFVYDGNGVCTEVRIMDTNDPNTATRWWRWNINGWGYTSDAGVTYTLAATMNGAIVADFIKSGTLDASLATITNLNASNITSGTLTSREINNGSGTFQVTEAGAVTASSGTIGGWKLASDRLQSSGGDVYLSPSQSLYALRTPNLQIGQNGDLQTSGKINLISPGSSQIEENGTPIVYISSSGVTRFGYLNNAIVTSNTSSDGISVVYKGTAYSLEKDANGYLYLVAQ